MTDQCPFCQLMAQPEQLNIVGETENFYAWLEYPQPRAKGHANVVPKEHVESVLEFSPDEYREAMILAREVMEKAVEGLDADGLSITMNIKEAGGQMLPHAYIQIFPRFQEDENAGTPTGAIFQHREDLQTEEYFKETMSQMDAVDVDFEVETVEPHPDSQKFKEESDSEQEEEENDQKEDDKEEQDNQESQSSGREKGSPPTSYSEEKGEGEPILEEEQNSREKEIDLTDDGSSIQWQ